MGPVFVKLSLCHSYPTGLRSYVLEDTAIVVCDLLVYAFIALRGLVLVL